MKLGGFGRIKDYEDIAKSGFDFAELDVPEIADLPENEFQAFLGKVKEIGFPVLTGSRALPLSDPWFFTDQYDKEKFRDFMDTACRRSAQLGIRKIILGNGKARYLLTEDSIKLENNFIETLRLYAEYADRYGIEMILEPLGPDYSNYLNTLPAAAEAVRKAGNPNLFIMADLRHLQLGNEPYEDIEKCARLVHHIHVDYPGTFPERYFPRTDDGFDYTPFLDEVKKIGYSDTLTIEADVPSDWKKAYADAYAVLNKYL
jgi:sugar phosphate isomerase/epimerase